MKKAAVLCLLAVVLLVGCGNSATPMTKYVNTANFVSDRFEEMTILVRLGAFDDDQLKGIKFWTDQAKSCLDMWYVNLKADPNNDFASDDSYRCVRSALLKLLVYQSEAPPEMQREALKEE